ncbi:hypothetical protein ACFV2N_46525 [Streptomyces sp. NPDC059680]|uniref:hypothetical protein n=1 Tax=Streptomyces sp. NPDC059680 TaxID=3346904 RepID=UPI0036BD96F7
MSIYSGDVEVFAGGRWHTARATLWGRRDKHSADTSRVRSAVTGRERWGGSIAMSDVRAAYEVYDDDDRKLRLPNGQERAFFVYSFATLMNITGNGSIPFN